MPYETREHSGASTALSMVHRNCNETRKGGIHAKHSLRVRPRILQGSEPGSATRRPLGFPDRQVERVRRQGEREGLREADVLAAYGGDASRRRARGQEHRPTGAQLRRDHRGVAPHHEAHGVLDSGARHAAARHPRDQGEHNGLFMSYFRLTEPLIP